MTRRAAVVGAAAALCLVGNGVPVLADNCGTPSDCFGVAGSFNTAALGLLGLAALSLLLDFVPVIGTGKGLAEAVTGRDAITGQPLSWWERALGVVPVVGGLAAVGSTARAADAVADAARAGGRTADDLASAGRGGRSGRGPSGGGGPSVHSRYRDGTAVYEGQQPPRIRGPDSQAQGPHSVLRHDDVHGRVYQGREYDASGHPVRDIDFTNPTYPSGAPRPGHPGPPHQHRWHVNDPAVGPRSGHRRGGPEPLD